MAKDMTLTGVERFFDAGDIIVSKTDPKGRINYVNSLFLTIADYSEREVVGQPHSVIRHPDMPRCIFKLLWDTISAGSELFAYVMNRTKFGDHYWVLAHVTPMRDDSGAVFGYHSSRRSPDRAALATIQPLYARLLAEEKRHANDKEGLAASAAMLATALKDHGLRYDQFIFSTLDGH